MKSTVSKQNNIISVCRGAYFCHKIIVHQNTRLCKQKEQYSQHNEM
jgi:hypothetical protein